ncbi:protein of unknown function [Taphrina deformans PYCC 5710]|uniref:Uncharacterized protein n=1 Tax=Taphrina deformans (strain PYCC 5710 / ATCC 11124 / CBS 356.35 / IMI 108563 / JCM 9778 / NBRC 8474) TaxID=1097556 RepID=R4XL63_TAPDE|nr:protein of unknown function [Taphrina deformans PYCC 5710]|eukprot:CCG84049.1 protein of unknown function [Taphrina deformans PYCC 5710]
MRAPSGNRIRRQPVVDELDHPGVLPPLDRPFDAILATRARIPRTSAEYHPNRRLLNNNHILALRRSARTTREQVTRKVTEDHGLSPQPIRVELLSCDGGSLDFDDSGRYNAENLLQDNVSVYCTAKLENVNILLRGAGARPFTLSRIEIKAPQRSFTSPVKDGLVFVSMDRINVSDSKIFDRDAEESDLGSEAECGSDLQRLLEGQELPCTTTNLEDDSVHKDVLRPHAYFVVDERLGFATILFEPAVSARYVHIKLLSGQPFDSYPGRFERDNIDIQAILLYGYGRRVFPSCQTR